jgi:CheY-like chemotaxis protein
LRFLGGYRVHIARDGRAALEYVRDPNNRVDLIAVDLHLTDMGGQEFVRHLVAEPRVQHAPVIAIAASPGSSDRERERVLELGADRFVGKPLHVPELAAEIERMLAERGLPVTPGWAAGPIGEQE